MQPTSRTSLRSDYRNPMRALAVLALAAGTWIPSLAFGQQNDVPLEPLLNNENLPTIPLNIINDYSTAEPLFVYIFGILNSASVSYPAGKCVIVTNTSGDITIAPPIPVNTPIPLGVNVGTGKSIKMRLPFLAGVRVYLSFGSSPVVQNDSTEGAIPSAPNGWTGPGNIENETNYKILFDWAEGTWVPKNAGPGHKTNLGFNVTQVDMFGLPLRIAITGNNPAQINPTPITEYCGFDQTRTDMLTAYAKLGTPWTTLLVDDGKGAVLRIIAPYHGIKNGVFDEDEMATYIDKVWKTATPLTATAQCGQDGSIVHHFVGTGDGTDLVFSDNKGITFSLPKPSTDTVWRNEIHPSPTPKDQLTQCLAGVVTTKLGGALVRTVALTDPNLDDCMVSQFYAAEPVQKYGEFFHQFGINGLAYSFGYDDSCSQSSFITVDDPTEMDIWISGSK